MDSTIFNGTTHFYFLGRVADVPPRSPPAAQSRKPPRSWREEPQTTASTAESLCSPWSRTAMATKRTRSFFYPGSRIRFLFPSRIRIFSIPDPGSASKNLSILTKKFVSKLSEIWARLFIPDPDPDSLPIPDPGSRGQKSTGSRMRIRISGFCKALAKRFSLLCIHSFYIHSATNYNICGFWLYYCNRLKFFILKVPVLTTKLRILNAKIKFQSLDLKVDIQRKALLEPFGTQQPALIKFILDKLLILLRRQNLLGLMIVLQCRRIMGMRRTADGPDV